MEGLNYAIIGGTGTLGQALTQKIRKHLKPREIYCLSRCELKQEGIRSLAKPVLCDITDYGQVIEALPHVDVCFHVAALKRVDRLESEVAQAINTNLMGTMNVVRACIEKQVPYMAFCTTDKAVEPINAYGMTKALAEKFIADMALKQDRTTFTTFRWGNVMGSRGSVLDYFVRCAKDKKPVNITATAMTRFWIDIDDAADFMLNNYGKGGTLLPEMKSSTVMDVINAVFDLYGAGLPELAVVGLRPGEKIHETIHADAWGRVTSQTCDKYTRAELERLITKHLRRTGQL